MVDILRHLTVKIWGEDRTSYCFHATQILLWVYNLLSSSLSISLSRPISELGDQDHNWVTLLLSQDEFGSWNIFFLPLLLTKMRWDPFFLRCLYPWSHPAEGNPGAVLLICWRSSQYLRVSQYLFVNFFPCNQHHLLLFYPTQSVVLTLASLSKLYPTEM